MIDPCAEAVLIRSATSDVYEDKTPQTHSHWVDGATTNVVLASRQGPRRYPYTVPGRVLILRDPVDVPLLDGAWVEVRGEAWTTVSGILRFVGPDGAWLRLFYPTRAGESYATYPEDEVRIVQDAARTANAAAVLGYLRRIVEALPDYDGRENPLRRSYRGLTAVHPDSVLGKYLNGEPIESHPPEHVPLSPFSSNPSQREAVRQALRHSMSVVEGPPGTGKTQTILNLVATLVAEPGTSVGVVSHSNTAVDNVRDKLAKEGFGYIAASLGRRDKKEEFFAAQDARNQAVDAMLADESAREGADMAAVPTAEQLADLDRTLERLQQDERRLERLRQDADAHRLEREHFVRYLDGHEVVDIDGLPLLRRSSARILDYLAETELAGDEGQEPWAFRWITRLRRLIRYGSLGELDAGDSEVVLALQRAYYDRRIEELEGEIRELERRLDGADLDGLLDRQRELSSRYLTARLRERYGTRSRQSYDARSSVGRFADFVADYPVIMSTCHSLRSSIGERHLLDYVIIDEASQVDLLAAALVLASCRRVVVVGDLRQLSHIPDARAADVAGEAPSAAYDYRDQSILSSLLALHGDAIPRTMLLEHYRCDPAIIGFCNDKFYGGALIPFTRAEPDSRALVLHPTVEGNHMRQHRGGGRSNRREADVIHREVIPRYCVGLRPEEIGIATPYRKQVETVRGSSIDDVMMDLEVDTVHRFQGREKRAVIMTTVLDETWRGRTGTAFVDDPRLVNVAVSRAVERFILVTDNEMLPTSRHLRDLMEYIRYQHPDDPIGESGVVSVFDLLYRRYSERLRPLASRLRGRMRYRSEDIVWTVLDELMAEEPYADLHVQPQVLLRNLIPDLERLTAEQAAFARRRSSVDFVVYRRVSKRPVLAIEVDGFAFHEDRPAQLVRDAVKDAILSTYDVPLLRLKTTESRELDRIRESLDAVA